MRKKKRVPYHQEAAPVRDHKPRFLFYFKTAHCAISVQSVNPESLEPLINKGFAAHRILLKLHSNLRCIRIERTFRKISNNLADCLAFCILHILCQLNFFRYLCLF